MTLTGPVTLETLPSHVPRELVRPYPFRDGRVTTEHPFKTIIPKLHEDIPSFYTLDGFHGVAPCWVFCRFNDVSAIYNDTEHFSAKNFTPFGQLEGGNWNLVPAESDPPDHTFHRATMNWLFTPKKVVALEQKVHKFARDAIDAFKSRGECDFMSEMAFQFPVAVFLDLMGLPFSEVQQFLAWETQLIHPKDMEDARQGTISVCGYLREVIAERRRNPREDLVTYGLNTEIDGRRLNDKEMLGFCFNLFIGGLDTVSTNMGWQARHLAEHPEHQAVLRADPSLIPNAIEEMLRAYAAVNTSRRVVKPVQLGGVQLMPGDVVTLSTPLANNDATVFDQPQQVRLDRKPRHVTFGTGIHRCLGAALARRELTIAMQELLTSLPEFRIKPGAEVKTMFGAIVQLESLPLVW